MVSIAVLGRDRRRRTLSRTNVASVGSAFKGTRKVKVLSLPEAIKEKSVVNIFIPRFTYQETV